MRITGGTYHGRRVECPPGIIRPAMDRMRESLFSILGNLNENSFFDLFSGSVGKSGIVKNDGIFIIHYPSEEKWEEQIGLFTCCDKRTYGRSVLRFFRYTEDPA